MKFQDLHELSAEIWVHLEIDPKTTAVMVTDGTGMERVEGS